MDRIIMHIDVNNAFLSWTAVDMLKSGSKLDIRTIPSVIGGSEENRRGIVLAKSTVAKQKGVKSAETIRDAKRKCSDLKVYPPDYRLYSKMSKLFFDYILKYTPDVEKLSIDECFIDYTNVKKLYGDPIKFAYELKDGIKKELGFTVNIGIANNRLCAKMASDFTKPDRVHTLFKDEIETKMYPLPIEDLYGCGKSTSAKLRSLNINTIGELAKSNPMDLKKYFKNQTEKLINSAKGISDDIVITKREDTTCISNSSTSSYNLKTIDEINLFLLPLVENVCRELRQKEKYASVVGVILRDTNFKTIQHQVKLKNPTNSTDEIYMVAKKLISEIWDLEKIRLVGISLSKLSSNLNYQLNIFEDINVTESNKELDKTIDKLKQTYGSKIIDKASKTYFDKK